MKYLLIIITALVLLGSCTQKVTIVPSIDADAIENFAAEELHAYLSKIYPDHEFVVSDVPGEGKNIFLDLVGENEISITSKEGYVISSENDKAYILSHGNTGLIYGVYGILEEIGCGFFMSDEFLPNPKKEFSFDEWNISNEPLIKERFVFNWHNFISGCTGWDKKHWFEWVDNSQKMGYNTVMVHTYHNNPMHTYSFNGIDKEVGYINTSQKGRDWGNIPINDVRRLPGGEIFSTPEIGSELAMVPDDQRVQVAQEAMAEVFDYALQRGVSVNFAFDIDMPLQFLKSTMIESIDKKDRFLLSKPNIWIPHPESPQGYAFYKAQLEGLFKAYPMLEDITFFRRGGSFFRNASLKDLPKEWQKEFAATKMQFPYLNDLNPQELIGSFITAKLVIGYKNILKDMGRENISLATGSWAHDFVVPTAAFLPDDIRLMPIDWDIRIKKSLIENDEILSDFANPECKNRVIPFLWAHHDDGEYVGRSYPPTEKLFSKLSKGSCEAFGTFHWMNRPLDLFFSGMIRQTWSASKNEDLEASCRHMAEKYFGDKNKSEYFMKWVKDAPIFGRATLMNFFHRPLKECMFDFEKAIKECEQRIAMLEGYNREGMTKKQASYIEYFKTLEKFIIDFSNTQPHLLNAQLLLTENKLDSAQIELQETDPNIFIQTFSRLSTIAKEERGEIAYTYRLASKYIPEYLSFEQRARLKPYRINIDSLVYEDLAQGNVNISYYVDPKGDFWERLGSRELNTHVQKLPEDIGSEQSLDPYKEIFIYGASLESGLTIPIRPIMRAPGIQNSGDVWKGKYELKILVRTLSEKDARFTIIIDGVSKEITTKGVDIISSSVNLKTNGLLNIQIEAVEGSPYICGLTLTPLL